MSIDRASQPAGNAGDPTVAHRSPGYGAAPQQPAYDAPAGYAPPPGIPQQQTAGYAPGFGGGPPGYGPPPLPPTPSGGKRTGLIAGIIAGVVLLGAIGAGLWFFLIANRHLDPMTVESEIVRVTQENDKTAPTGVTCPDDVPFESGRTFTCTATLLNKPVTYTITQTNDDGAVTIRYPRPVLDPASVSKEVVLVTQTQTGVAPDGVQCPSDVRFQKGGTFTCSATIEQQPLSYAITQTDDNGGLSIAYTRVLEIASLNDALSSRLSTDVGENIVAVCGADGQTVLVNEPGTTIRCGAANAVDPTRNAPVLVTVDQAGAISYDIQ